jgi:hypothetical protein
LRETGGLAPLQLSLSDYGERATERMAGEDNLLSWSLPSWQIQQLMNKKERFQ